MPAQAARATLQQARIERLLSAYSLAKRAQVAATTITEIERGSKPRLSTIAKLSAALGVNPREIDWPGDPLGQRA